MQRGSCHGLLDLSIVPGAPGAGRISASVPDGSIVRAFE